MCGIAGFITERARIPRRCRGCSRASPTAALTARACGTGSRGGWQVALGHRRLSIIDVAGGAQPMENADGDVVITYNGEVYNFMRAARGAGAARATGSGRAATPRSILQQFEQHGVGGIAALDGMFAFAIWEARDAAADAGARPRRHQAALLRRARRRRHRVRVRAVRAARPRRRRPRAVDRRAGVVLLLRLRPPAARRSCARCASCRPATRSSGRTATSGCRARTGRCRAPAPGARASPTPSWRPSCGRTSSRVGRRRSWSPTCRSASSCRAASIRRASPRRRVAAGGRMKAFSIGFEDATFDEIDATRAWWPSGSTSSGSPRRCTSATCWTSWTPRSTSIDEPLADPSFLPTFLLSRLAARHVKVVVGGDGGDELWGGYPTYRAHRLRRASTRRVPGWIRKHVVGARRRAGCRSTIATRAWSGSCAGSRSAGTTTWSPATCAGCPASTCPTWRARSRRAKGCGRRRWRRRCPRPTTRLQRILALDFSTYMPGSVLTKVDRASMAHGLEVRPPLLDDALVEWAFSLPSRYKLRRGAGKYLLKLAARGQDPRRDHRPAQEGVRHPAGGLAARAAHGPHRGGGRAIAGLRSRHPRRRRVRGWNRRPPGQAAPITASRCGRCSCWITGSAVTRQLPRPPRTAWPTDEDRKTAQGSPDRFGYEWATYSAILPESQRPAGTLARADDARQLRGKRVMDVGCGMGRNPYWYVEAGADVGAGRRHGRRQPGGRAQEPGAVRQRARREGLGARAGSAGARHLRSRHLHRRAAPPGRARERAAADVELRRARAAIWCCGATRRKATG